MDLASLRVLVVDDYAETAQMLSLLLRVVLSCDARPCRSAEACLSLCAEVDPHVAILDIAMPGMHGYDLARYLRKENGPVLIAITGMPINEQRLTEVGIKHWFMKPIDIEELRVVLEDVARGLPRNGGSSPGL